MNETSILTKKELLLLKGVYLQDLSFPDLEEHHFKLVKLEEEFLSSIDKCSKIDGIDYEDLYLRTFIGNQARILMTLDLRDTWYSEYEAANNLPSGTKHALVMLASEERSGRAISNNNGEKTIRKQWAVRICEECGKYFSTSIGGKNIHAKYCSDKCKYAAAYKRKRARQKVDPIAQDIKECKGALKTVENLLAKYPHFINSESTLQGLQTILQQIEHEQF